MIYHRRKFNVKIVYIACIVETDTIMSKYNIFVNMWIIIQIYIYLFLSVRPNSIFCVFDNRMCIGYFCLLSEKILSNCVDEFAYLINRPGVKPITSPGYPGNYSTYVSLYYYTHELSPRTGWPLSTCVILCLMSIILLYMYVWWCSNKVYRWL